MKFSHRHYHWPSLLILLFSFCLSFPLSEAQTPTEHEAKTTNNETVSCLLVFGDSTVDPGNNNYIPTVFKSNFPPYGKDFKDHVPTGRFTNGRLSTDFLVSYGGYKDNVPAYLDPSLGIDDLLSGVSFASAGSGFDPLTSTISSVIDMPTQVKYFKEYKKKIESVIGKERMENHVKKAVFLVSAGTNDFVNNYFGIPIRRKSFTLSAYQQFLINKVNQFIQNLWDEGARKIAVTGLPPMGCLPIVITLNSYDAIQQRDCIERYSSAARDYNLMLQKELKLFQTNLAHSGFKLLYVDIYTPLVDMIQNPGKFGFDEVNSGCCGTGYLEASLLCNQKSNLCPDAAKYVFFDAVHPTEKAYYNLFEATRSLVSMIQEE